jgi:uncharacterized protein
MKCFFALLFFLAIWDTSSQAFQSLEVPVLRTHVTDLTSTLSLSQRQDLESRLLAFEDTTSVQIAVLLVPTLKGESLEDFSIQVAEKNKIGQRKADNGVILLIVRQDRLVRIEVGYGLESKLTDALTGQIVRDVLRPRFREGDYCGGIEQGLSAIMGLVKGEEVALLSPQRGIRAVMTLAGSYLSFSLGFSHSPSCHG